MTGRLLLAVLVALACWSRLPSPLRAAAAEGGLQPEQLAVVANREDPLSMKIARYYLERHGLPEDNLVYVEFEPGEAVMHPGVFAALQKVVEARVPPDTQAYLLTWTEPYRVGCMSITSAFAFGYDQKYCASGCKPTALNRYAVSASLRPWQDFGMRPAMLLAADTMEEARELIDRGAASRGWFYNGEDRVAAAYLVETSDRNRNVRKRFYPAAAARFGDRIDVHIEQAEAIEDAGDVMFYFIGAREVAAIDSNRYLPGAVADHLTSTGGKLTDGRQMSALEWLRAGATGSYGTVVEPCNFPGKFPQPERMMEQYLDGRTLLEAYWKSVLMPGQGVFIGDPLAAPFARPPAGTVAAETAPGGRSAGNLKAQ